MQEMRLHKGHWLQEEDKRLATAVAVLGDKRWDSLAKASGLKRSGKSCRLRWMNYLRPNLKHGEITAEEERVIVELHAKWGNKWSRIAEELPGRTDNEIKNYWRSYKKKAHAAAKDSSSSTVSLSGNESLRSECEKSTTSPCSVTGESFSFQSDVQGFIPDSFDVLDMFNPTVSPYDARLTASMSNWFSAADNQETNDGCSNLHNPEWMSYDSNINIWDFPLWDNS